MKVFLLLLTASSALFAAELTLFVDAHGLDYSSAQALAGSLRRQKTDATFGHAWIRLEREGFILEGGHTGECTFDGIAVYGAKGDPNPIRYLWETKSNGRFQEGSGGHTPTHIAHITIDDATFDRIVQFIEEGEYPFGHYNLTRHQCTTFVVQVAALAGVDLDHMVSVPIEPALKIGRQKLTLWSDSKYSVFELAAPERLVENPVFTRLGSRSPSNGSRCRRRRCCR